MNVSVSMAAAEIDFNKSKEAVNGILDLLIERSKFKPYTINGQADNYWEVLGDDLFDMGNKPGQLGVGSLSDDIDPLESYLQQLSSGSPPVIYSLIHVVPILRFVAEQHSKSNNP
jgi:hypothetical protein